MTHMLLKTKDFPTKEMRVGDWRVSETTDGLIRNMYVCMYNIRCLQDVRHASDFESLVSIPNTWL